MSALRLLAAFCCLCLAGTRSAASDSAVAKMRKPVPAAFSPSAAGRFFRPEPGFTRAKDLPEDFRARIRSIRFEVKDAFEGSTAHSKAERWAFGLGNKLHIETRSATLRRRLLFREGGEAGKGLLLETEKALRSEEFLADAILEAGPVEDGACEVKVTTYDQWTTILGGAVGVQNFKPADFFLGRWDQLTEGEWLWWVGAWESNFLGSGTKLGGALRHDLQRDSRELRLQNNSVGEQRLQMGANIAWLSDGHAYQAKLAKPLLSRADRFAFAVALSSLQLTESVYFDANRLGDLPDSLADDKAGKSHVLREYRRVTTDSLYLSATRSYGDRLKVSVGPIFLFQDRYQKSGQVPGDTALLAAVPLPASAATPELRDEALLGAAVSLYQYDYKTARNFRNLKWNESVETGWRLTARAALNQEWLGASHAEIWLAQEAAYGDAWRETYFASCSLGAQYFIAPSGKPRDGRLDASLETQWKPLAITASFLSASWSHLFATPASRQLLLGATEGLNGYPSFYFAGQARCLLVAEQRLFPEFEWATLVPAFSAFLAAGNTFPSYRDFRPSDLHYSLGLGLRLGKSKSTTKGIQHFNVSFPVGDKHLRGPSVSVLAKKTL